MAFCGVLMAGLPIKLYLGIRDGKADGTSTSRIVAVDAGKTDCGNRKIFRVTAYDADCEICCGRYARIPVSSGQRRTASGHIITDADYGNLCAAPESYPFGTRILLEGFGEVVVRDRGGSIKKAGDTVAGEILKHDRIDILFRTHQEALNFGVKYLKGTIETEPRVR
jgi:3D (Asp-Asp-Asp) domain-containing protein